LKYEKNVKYVFSGCDGDVVVCVFPVGVQLLYSCVSWWSMYLRDPCDMCVCGRQTL